jgi:hypothetical protein
MRPLTCAGGYGVPMTFDGRQRILKITAACSSINSESRLQLVDTSRVLPSEKTPKEALIVDLKRVAACDANIVWDAPDSKNPLTIHGNLFPMLMTNLVVGSTMVYVK